MAEVPELSPTVTPGATPPAASLLSSTALLPLDTLPMEAHAIVMVVVFCVVSLLLLMAFLYAFCFHCSIRASLKDLGTANRCSQEREDATYKRSSSDGMSEANVV